MTDTKEEIKEGYENQDTGLLTTGSLSASDIKEGLRELTNDEFSEFKKLRNGAYYYDPFGLPEGTSVTDELKHLFKTNLVVNSQTIQSRFDIAPADVDFFAGALVDQGYISRISTGDRDYYRSGPDLRDETSGDASVSARLEKEASYGTLSHSKLENVIDVAATSDVIRHLDNEGFIVDLGDEYLVQSCFGEYAQYLVNEIGDDVVGEFDDAGIMTVDEFEQVVENEIAERYDVLHHLGRNHTSQLFDSVKEQLKEVHGLSENKTVILQDEEFERHVDARAEQILEDANQQSLGQPSEIVDEGKPDINEIVISNADRVNTYVRDAVTERFETKVDAMFEIDSDSN